MSLIFIFDRIEVKLFPAYFNIFNKLRIYFELIVHKQPFLLQKITRMALIADHLDNGHV